MGCDDDEKEMRTSGCLVRVEFSSASPHQSVLSIHTVIVDFLVIHGKA